MFKKCLVLTVVLLGTVFSIGFIGSISCCDSAPGSHKASTKSVNVVVAQWGQEKYLIYLPLYIAMEKGFFDKQGLSVSLRFSGNDDQVFASVLQGGAQFGVGDPVFTAIANEKGGDVGRVVASIVDGVAIWGVTNNNSITTIDSPKALSGLRVGTFPAPSTNYTLMKNTILSGGGEMGSAKTVEAPIGSQIALLESGSADIAMVLEPAASIAESEGYRVVFSSPKFYGPFAFTGLTVSADYLKKQPDVVQKMVSALQDALNFCHSNLEESNAIAARLFPAVDKGVIVKAVHRMVSEQTVPKSAIVREQAWSAATKVRVDVGDLKSGDSYAACVDTSFAKKAADALK